MVSERRLALKRCEWSVYLVLRQWSRQSDGDPAGIWGVFSELLLKHVVDRCLVDWIFFKNYLFARAINLLN